MTQTDRAAPRQLALVTGASSGIGYDLARQFAAHGFDLVVAAEDAAIEDATVTLRAMGGVVEPVQVDLARADGVDHLYARVQATGRSPDAVAINAGIAVNGPFAETDLAEEVRLIELNVTSSVRLAKRALQDMVPRGAGRILITSSIAAEGPGPYTAIYSASKAFLLSFAEAIRYELRDTGVTVTALQPGATDTAIFARAGMEDTKLGASPKISAAEVAKAGFEALMAGKDHVVAASVKERVQVAVGPLVPATVKAAAQGALTKPGSADS